MVFDLKKWASSFCIFSIYIQLYRPTPCGENSLVICHLYGFPMHLSSCNLPLWLTNLAIIHIFQLPLVKRKKCLVPHMTNCSCECDCECECNCNGNCNTECNALLTRNQRNFSNFSGISHSIANGTQSVPRIYSRLERYRYEMAEAKQTANQNTKQLTWLMYIYKQKHGEKANFFAQKKTNYNENEFKTGWDRSRFASEKLRNYEENLEELGEAGGEWLKLQPRL